MAKNFKDLTEREILALAVSLEEEDGRIYGEFAEGLRENYPGTAKLLDEMQAEESEHRSSLIDLYRSRFGEHIPLIRRQDVKGFVSRPAVWLIRPIGPKAVRTAIEQMETETRRFYEIALQRTTDASTRKLLGDLAEAEVKHTAAAEAVEKYELTPEVRTAEDDAYRRNFILQFVQPGLAGLMDGSVSTLAPVFAAALGVARLLPAHLEFLDVQTVLTAMAANDVSGGAGYDQMLESLEQDAAARQKACRLVPARPCAAPAKQIASPVPTLR